MDGTSMTVVHLECDPVTNCQLIQAVPRLSVSIFSKLFCFCCKCLARCASRAGNNSQSKADFDESSLLFMELADLC